MGLSNEQCLAQAGVHLNLGTLREGTWITQQGGGEAMADCRVDLGQGWGWHAKGSVLVGFCQQKLEPPVLCLHVAGRRLELTFQGQPDEPWGGTRHPVTHQ